MRKGRGGPLLLGSFSLPVPARDQVKRKEEEEDAEGDQEEGSFNRASHLISIFLPETTERETSARHKQTQAWHDVEKRCRREAAAEMGAGEARSEGREKERTERVASLTRRSRIGNTHRVTAAAAAFQVQLKMRMTPKASPRTVTFRIQVVALLTEERDERTQHSSVECWCRYGGGR